MIRLLEQADANRMLAVGNQNFHRAVFWRDVKTFLRSINELDPVAAHGEFDAVTAELDAFVTAMKRVASPRGVRNENIGEEHSKG